MKQRGLTIIELVVTIAVLALILALAMPSIGTWMDNTRIRNTTEALQNGLLAARTEAIRRNQNVSFFLVTLNDAGTMDNTCALSTESGSWVISVSSPAGKCASAPSTTDAPMIVDRRTVRDGGGGVKVTADNSMVTFNSFGRVVSAAGASLTQVEVTGVKDGTHYRNLRVNVTPSGAVRMCDPNVPSTATTDPRLCAAESR
ncbi:GspH/FimT family pseudopilin [Variovorax sp. TBS-050B]|uniref:GspH/FimT family pseudopilin n=1 Tax=Variovorax sp. TBS-050B TaxID=2940551 RepID=UPI0024769612|nr:GspH/FimT family pseudopilin [Variovorax sp. TBS-050B]